MDSHSCGMGPHTDLSALEASRRMSSLAAYIGVCPTCLGWDDPEADASEREAKPGRPVCPTCGLASVEWDLAAEIDQQVRRLQGFERLDRAVTEGED